MKKYHIRCIIPARNIRTPKELVKNMNGYKIAITGGAGFIGSNLAKALCYDNQVVIIDDLSTGKLENIEDCVKKELVTAKIGTISDYEFLKGAFQDVDFVFHLAAIPSVQLSLSNPSLTNEVNLKGTLNVLLASRENDVKKVVYASSAAVYGNVEIVPLKEEMPTIPESPYGTQKLGGEHYLRVFYEVYGLATTSLRFFNVFGPNQDPYSQYSPVIPKFITALSQDMPPMIYGDGKQTRDFIYVDDVVLACILATNSPPSDGKVINIAGGMETSINHLSQIISKEMKKEIEPIHTEERKGEVKRSYADISLAKDILNFTPKFPLEKGLGLTIEHFAMTA
jgi:UDP-glucose 4-epimerase